MALCLAESLIERRGFDPVDQLERYVRWYREGHWSSTGTCFDIGNATRARWSASSAPASRSRATPSRDAAGNGPLMKLAPVALAFASPPDARGRVRRAERAHDPRRGRGGRRAPGTSRGCSSRRSRRDRRRGPQRAGSGPAPEDRDGRGRLRSVRRRRPRSAAAGTSCDALEAALWALHTTSIVRGGRARRRQSRRRRGHHRRDLRPAGGRAVRRRRRSPRPGASGWRCATRSWRSPTRSSSLSQRSDVAEHSTVAVERAPRTKSEARVWSQVAAIRCALPRLAPHPRRTRAAPAPHPRRTRAAAAPHRAAPPRKTYRSSRASTFSGGRRETRRSRRGASPVGDGAPAHSWRGGIGGFSTSQVENPPIGDRAAGNERPDRLPARPATDHGKVEGRRQFLRAQQSPGAAQSEATTEAPRKHRTTQTALLPNAALLVAAAAPPHTSRRAPRPASPEAVSRRSAARRRRSSRTCPRRA